MRADDKGGGEGRQAGRQAGTDKKTDTWAQKDRWTDG